MRTVIRFLLRPQNIVGLAIVIGFFYVAAAAPALAPPTHDPNLPSYLSRVGRRTDTTPHPPSETAPLGTLSGQLSVYYTLIWGTRSAVRFGIVVAAATAAIGVVVGAISGYLGGWVQRLVIPITDAFLAFPAIAGYWVVRYSLFPEDPTVLTTFMQTLVVRLGLDPLMVALILFSWMPYARITASSTMRLRQIEYVQAARALGAGSLRIVARHIVPNLIAPVVVLAARDVGGTVMLAAAFTFIGIGGDLPWGELLAIGRDWIIGPGGSLTAYWWIYAPVTGALLLFGIGWNLLGDGLNDQIAGRRSVTLIDLVRRRWFAPAAGLALGLAAGLTYSWVVDPVHLIDAAPEQLSRDYRQDYLRAAADSFALTTDVETAVKRYQALGIHALSSLSSLRRPTVSVADPELEGLAFVLDSLGATAASGAAPPADASPWWFAAAALAVAAVAGRSLTTLRRRRRRRPAPQQAPPEIGTRLAAVTAGDRFDMLTTAAEPRPAQVFQATYPPTQAEPDPTFVVEDPSGAFLGECGVSSAELVAATTPAPAAALEVWLFDKAGMQTASAFLVPPEVRLDDELRQSLAGRGEVLPAREGILFQLEGPRLRLDARLKAIELEPLQTPQGAGIRRAELDLLVNPLPSRAG